MGSEQKTLLGPSHTMTVSCCRTHANGSIKRGSKDNATESVSLRTGIGVQLKDIKVFNRARQKGPSGLGAHGAGRGVEGARSGCCAFRAEI